MSYYIISPPVGGRRFCLSLPPGVAKITVWIAVLAIIFTALTACGVKGPLKTPSQIEQEAREKEAKQESQAEDGPF